MNFNSLAHILLVDDCEDLLYLYSRLLEQLGYRVSIALDGQQALEKFKENRGRFSMVISDYRMPNMDGIELIMAVRELDQQVPVLMVSGDLQSFLSEKIKGLNVQLASKPVPIETFISLVGRMLGNPAVSV